MNRKELSKINSLPANRSAMEEMKERGIVAVWTAPHILTLARALHEEFTERK